jgi:hypothetical protein
MDVFMSTFGGVAALCLGVIILAVFFSLLNRLTGGGNKIIKFHGLLKEAAWVNVHLVGGNILERMKFVGFTDPPSAKGNIPFHLRNMVVLENDHGLRTLIKAEAIKMIEEIQP